jgi:hypothetical protein
MGFTKSDHDFGFSASDDTAADRSASDDTAADRQVQSSRFRVRGMKVNVMEIDVVFMVFYIILIDIVILCLFFVFSLLVFNFIYLFY